MSSTRLSAAATALFVSGTALATEYELDQTHSTIGFSVRHMMVVNQRGQFQKVSGTLHWNEQEPTNVAKHPSMTFRSTRFERAGEGWRITGDLSLHGVTKPVVLEAGPLSPESKDPFGAIKVGTSATTSLSRKDFGLTWNKALETGGIAVGDEVKITLDLEFNRRK
jgi:polyisoprenoid-binding protein YceI